MSAIRRLFNKSKLLTNNSNFTLQINSIDGVLLTPNPINENKIIDGLFHSNHLLNSENEKIKNVISKLTFDKDGFAQTYFEFNIGPGIPKNYMPFGVRILDTNISLLNYMNGSFFAPESEIWRKIKPSIENHHFVATELFQLLSDLQERKIHLQFPAIINMNSAEIFGAVPTTGNLKGFLREKRII